MKKQTGLHWEGIVIFVRMVRDGLTKKETFKQRLEGWEKSKRKTVMIG